MADSSKPNGDLVDTMKPFHERASQAEERLARLEAALSNRKDAGDEKCAAMVKDLQLKLDEVTAELASEREKVNKLIADSLKKDYRIKHLVQSLKELFPESQKKADS